jgi:hypothetical protein
LGYGISNFKQWWRYYFFGFGLRAIASRDLATIYDAGSENNNELCSSIPGRACPGESGNVHSGDGEGVVHVHRGFFGIGNLRQADYDWRNPMVMVEVS